MYIIIDKTVLVNITKEAKIYSEVHSCLNYNELIRVLKTNINYDYYELKHDVLLTTAFNFQKLRTK